jgi:hypothetical protein
MVEQYLLWCILILKYTFWTKTTGLLRVDDKTKYHNIHITVRFEKSVSGTADHVLDKMLVNSKSHLKHSHQLFKTDISLQCEQCNHYT